MGGASAEAGRTEAHGAPGAVIETRGLWKYYDDAPAVRGLDLTVRRGEVCALVGPNGAGKSTTLRMLAALLEPTEGEVLVCGASARETPGEVHRRVGFLPDFFGFYDDLKCWEYLDYFASAYGVADRELAVSSALSRVGLEAKRDGLIGTLSRGMRQRLAIGRCLIHDPEVLLLDEPASGLDPRARIDLRELIKSLRAAGKTMLVSSHILSELSDFCTSVALMEKGRLVESGTISEVLERSGKMRVLVVKVLSGAERASEIISGAPSVAGLERKGEGTIEAAYSGPREALPGLHRALATDPGVKLIAFYEREGDIEDIFLRLSSGETS